MPEPGDAVVRDVDADVDAEMEDAQDPTTTTNNNNNNIAATSAPRNPNEAVVDSEFTQPETQPTTTSGLAHQNRKDVTLREFLSKMDDYAPIVRTTNGPPRAARPHPFSEPTAGRDRKEKNWNSSD